MSSTTRVNPFFLPTQISGCQLWLDAADPAGTGVIPSNGATISLWRDKSPLSYPVTITGSPTYSSSSRGVQFSGTQYVSNSSFSLNLSQMTVFLVGYNGAGIAGSGGFLSLVPIATGVDWNQQNAITYNYSVNLGELYITYNFNGSAFNQNYTSTTNPILFGHVQSGTSITLYRNGSSFVNSTLNVTPGTTTGFSVGARFQSGNGTANAYLYGSVNEVLIYSQALSTSQREQVEGYLAWKWGLQASLPATHPYKNSLIPPLLNPPLTPSVSGTNAFFLPTQISGCQLWLDAADPTTFSLINNSIITQWRDKSGNGRTATPGGSPVLQQKSINGLSAVYYDGNTSSVFGGSISITTSSIYAFVVFVSNLTAGTEGMRIISFTGPGCSDWNCSTTVIPFLHDTNRMQTFRNNAATTNLTCPSQGSTILTTTYYNGSIAYNSLFGGTSSSAIGSSGSFNISSYNMTFGNVNMRGKLAEVIIYNTVLTTAQLQQVEGYLAWKWGVQSSLSANYPYKSSLFPPLINPPVSVPTATAVSFLPNQISGTQVWLDGADPNGNGTVPANGTLISTWRDKSGNNTNATQATAINQPVYQTKMLNGLPTLQFPAISRNNLVALDTPTFNYGTTNRTSFFVLRNNYSSGTPAASPHWFWPKSGNGTTAQSLVGWIESIDRNTGVSLPITAPVGSFFILSNIFGATSLFEQMYTNGNPSNGNSLTRAGAYISATSGYRIGALDNNDSNSSVYWFDGNIAEVILFNRTLTVPQIKQVEGYLAWKWGLVASLPANHPFKLWPPLPLAYTASLSGGTQITAGGYTYHLFTTSGTLTTNTSGTVNYLVVGGGGGGGDRHGGGGGAGGVLSGTFTASATYTITVGAGGQYGATSEGGQTPYGDPNGSGTKGGDSSISGVITAYGGGGGGTYDGNPTGVSGPVGSGGGGGGQNLPGVTATSGQGNNGGSGANPGGGGGGGAGANGSSANTSTGGIGTSAYSTHLLNVGYGTSFATSPQSPLSGGVAYIAGGGGGGADSGTNPTARVGGLGGGGTGDWDDAVITAGTSNTGGGGGASRSNNSGTTGRNGGSGLVLVWY